MSEVTCPICTSEKVKSPNPGGFGKLVYECEICGEFCISRELADDLPTMKTNPRLISAWIRSQNEINNKIPFVNSELVENLTKYPQNISTLGKQLLLLRAIERRTDYPGKEILLLADRDYPLAYANNDKEMIFLSKSLEQRGFITLNKERLELGIIQTTITSTGWEYLDSQANKPTFSNQAFVAMSFDKSLESAWEEGIKLAIEEAGYKAYRIDKEHHIDRIDAKIISDIKDSLFVVADVTHQKQGVYFEAGFAIGLNRPVIWCVKKDELDNVHFDTRQYNHIVWETPEQLKEQLYYRICAVIGKRSRLDQ